MSPTPPPPDTAIFDRNLEALRAEDADLALRLAGLDISPFSPTPAHTRDGRLSFRLTRTEGQREWLGRTSIPGVRAAALLEQFDPGNRNVLLPGFGEGTEIHNLLAKLDPHRLVFVWEPELITIRLGLALRDYRGGLTGSRLIILQCPNTHLTEELARWLIGHPHHQCPTRLMAWPWQSQAELAECRSAVEAAWQQVHGGQR
jgi:hypothetical protein